VQTILCYGDSNTWGCVPAEGDEPTQRYGPDERWPGVLRRDLGDGYWVVEEGLNGRTTVRDDPLEPHRNGRAFLIPCLTSHYPLDLVVVMLGTNDLKQRFGVAAAEIAAGAGILVDEILRSPTGRDGGPPGVLLVCPPPLARLVDEDFVGGPEKSRELAPHYAAIAEARACAFLDAGAHITTSDVDGIHLEADQHRRLGEVVAARARELLD
jgi:lysophospholipase L1-like esterase